MLNVFSDSKLKMSEKIRELQKCAGSSYTQLLFAGEKSEPLYMLKPELINILKWINEKILFDAPKTKNTDPIRTGVRIRIAINMLNKQVDSGNIPKDIAIAYHERLTTRMRKILSEIWTEDLPF